jgi:hypothetical protein
MNGEYGLFYFFSSKLTCFIFICLSFSTTISFLCVHERIIICFVKIIVLVDVQYIRNMNALD